MLFVAYLFRAGTVSMVSIVFGLVALLSARVLNWRKDRLELKTDMMRNAYLASAFFIIPYALYHTVPAAYVSMSWVVVAIFYFAMSVLLKNNRKYRWMALLTFCVTIGYVFIVDIGTWIPPSAFFPSLFSALRSPGSRFSTRGSGQSRRKRIMRIPSQKKCHKVFKNVRSAFMEKVQLCRFRAPPAVADEGRRDFLKYVLGGVAACLDRCGGLSGPVLSQTAPPGRSGSHQREGRETLGHCEGQRDHRAVWEQTGDSDPDTRPISWWHFLPSALTSIAQCSTGAISA